MLHKLAVRDVGDVCMQCEMCVCLLLWFAHAFCLATDLCILFACSRVLMLALACSGHPCSCAVL